MPPHERSWRHPSELAAEETALVRAELAPSTSRAFALTTGTIGLVAIAVLVLAMSPSRGQEPLAVIATTAPADVVPAVDPSTPATVVSVRRTERQSGPAADVPVAVVALATPLGPGRYALVSLAAVVPTSTTDLDVVLPSGRTTHGRVVERSSESLLVYLTDSEPGHDIAEQRPHDRDLVTVMSQPPVKVTFADVASLEVEEGTAVIDSAGDLVGLCTGSGHGKRTRLIAVDTTMAMLDEAFDTDPPIDRSPDTTLVALTTTTIVTATVVDSTVAVTTTTIVDTTSSTTTSTTTSVPDDDPPTTEPGD